MSQEHAAHVEAEEGPVWLRPWRVLLMGLGAIVVGTLLLASQERYQITDGVLASMRGAQLPEFVLSELNAMKGKSAESRQEFADGLGGVLSEEALKQFQYSVFAHAKVDNPLVTPVGLLLILVGLIAGGWAVTQRLTTTSDDFDERVVSAALVAVFGFTGIVGFLGMAVPWFSGRIFFGFFIVFTIGGSLLILLPRMARRLVITLLVLFHFGGIIVASTAIPPPNGQVAWLPMMLWSRVYRPYLTGLYLTNAYHFYAPDPGSSTLVWIRIEYEDGSYRWIKFPNRAEAETTLHYQRQMGMCEATSNPLVPPPSPQQLDELKRQRMMAGNFFPTDDGKGIKLAVDRLDYTQYSPPNDYSRIIIRSMARHVCRFYPHDKDPSIQAKRVKIYRVTYTILMPGELLRGTPPLSDDLKLPYFMGEFDREGQLVRSDNVAEGYDDPFLFWAIPMDRLKYHAGDVKALKPGEEKKP